MTTPQQPDPAAEKNIGQYLRPLRDLAVYALIGAPAVFLFVALLSLLGDDFSLSARYSFGSFVNVATVFFPLAAVLLSLGVKPVHPKARLITMAALGEYAVASFFGVVFGLLFGVSGIAADDALAAFSALLERVAWLGVLGLAGYAVLQIWLGYYPRVKPQPGVYGQPYQYGPPPGYGQQQYGAPQPPVSFPGPGAPQPPASFPGPVPPGAPVQPPVATQPFNAGAAPYGQYPSVPQPQPGWAPPPPPPPYAEPTQPVPPRVPPVPSAPPASDRTEVLPDERPGFGPAAQDPPRQ